MEESTQNTVPYKKYFLLFEWDLIMGFKNKFQLLYKIKHSRGERGGKV